MVATLKDGPEAWRTRSLAALDVIYIYLDGFALRVRRAGKVVSVPVLGLIGVFPDGHKHLRALELCGGESFASWKGCTGAGDHRGEWWAAARRRVGVAPRGSATLAASISFAIFSERRRSTRWWKSNTTSIASFTRPMLTQPALPTRPSSARGPSAAGLGDESGGRG
ncbi:MAG: hypothetical protein DME17_18925 [Candidatus Rokuibacteriota bacterium]|nr:MAG: hypothetical protein DME17_18925 [Candidatus Rokubacteria bacterium]